MFGPRVVLTKKEQVMPGTSNYRISKVEFHFDPDRIVVVLKGDNEEMKTVTYSRNEATVLLEDMQKSLQTLKGLRKYVLERLLVDKKLLGVFAP